LKKATPQLIVSIGTGKNEVVEEDIAKSGKFYMVKLLFSHLPSIICDSEMTHKRFERTTKETYFRFNPVSFRGKKYPMSLSTLPLQKSLTFSKTLLQHILPTVMCKIN
jgi:hypothetical protein